MGGAHAILHIASQIGTTVAACRRNSTRPLCSPPSLYLLLTRCFWPVPTSLLHILLVLLYLINFLPPSLHHQQLSTSLSASSSTVYLPLCIIINFLPPSLQLQLPGVRRQPLLQLCTTATALQQLPPEQPRVRILNTGSPAAAHHTPQTAARSCTNPCLSSSRDCGCIR